MSDLVSEIVPASELRATPPKFVASQSGNTPPMNASEEQAIRALFQKADQEGLDGNMVVTLPTAPSVEQPIQQSQLPDIPSKFQKPDGTVDEEKLKTSNERLKQGLEEKQKSIDEMLAEYRTNEREFTSKSRQLSELKKNGSSIQEIPIGQPSPSEDPQQLYQRIQQDYQRDPINTNINLTQAVIQKELAPIIQRFRQDDEVRRDQTLRENMVRLAERDPRIAHPQLYSELLNELKSDPHYFGLQNPVKAAWNEVKDRLRLGEPLMVPAQPSMSGSPTLGRSSPPSVSTLSQPFTPQNLSQQIGQVNPYSEDGKRVEEQLRAATKDLWQY